MERNCSLGWFTIPRGGRVPHNAVVDACVLSDEGRCFVSWNRWGGVWGINEYNVRDDPDYDDYNFFFSNQGYLDFYYQEYGFHKDKTVNILVVI